MIEDQNTIEELTGKYRNYRMKAIVRMTQGISKMLNQYAVRRPEIRSTRWREEISGITGQTNKGFNSLNFILTDSPVHKRFRVRK